MMEVAWGFLGLVNDLCFQDTGTLTEDRKVQ